MGTKLSPVTEVYFLLHATLPPLSYTHSKEYLWTHAKVTAININVILENVT